MFDIDKLFLSTLHYNKKDVRDSSGNLLSRTISKEFKEDSEQYYANRLILDYISLLKDSRSIDDTTTRSMQVGDASIDNDTKLLTDIVEDLEGSLEEDLDPYDTYSLWRNTSIRDQFITGKFGIGPFALNNNNHILTMLYGVRFANNPGSILGITGHESLHDAEDMYGESIMSWLSGLINAHVDVAKDPYISKLNVNKYTYNLVNLMIRTGFGKMTFYFMTQPIMKELAMRVNNAASAYGSDSTKSKFRRQKDAEDQFIIDYANAHLEEGAVKYEKVDDVIEGFRKHLNKLGTSKTQLIKAIFDPKSDFLHEISKSKESLDSDKTFVVETSGGKVKLNMYEAQMLVYAAKLDFDPYSDGISQLVKYCKIDTKKQGKNISEQRDFKRGYRRLFVNNKSKLHRLFDDESLQALRHQSYIKTKTELALNMFSDILSDQLLDATRAFNGQVEDVIRELPVEDDEVSQQLAKKVSDAILVGVRSDYFNTYASRNNINIKGLVSGNNTIYDRLNKLKVAIQTDDKYAELRNPDGSIDNYLLNILTSGYTHKQVVLKEQTPSVVEETYPDAKFVSSMTFMSDDSVDADEVSEAWEELLEDSRFPELQQLAKDLIVYSFITTGGNGGSNNIFKYIPISWLVNPDGNGYQASYAHFMEQKLENYRNMTDSGFNIDDVILNNWTDEQFIPTITTQDVDTFYSGQSGYTVVNGRQVNPNTDIPIIIRTKTKNPSRFVKIRRQYDPESQRSVAIYKRVKVSGDGSVYVLIDPKGQNFGGKNKIFEYGRSDAGVREVAVQLNLNPSLVAAAQTAGADMNSIESVLNSLIRFVDSKEDKRGAIDVLKNFGVKDLLSEVIQENVDFGEDEEDVNDVLPPMRGINDTGGEYTPFEEVSPEESVQNNESAEQKINRLFDEITSINLSEKEQKRIEEIRSRLLEVGDKYKDIKSTKGFITDLSSAFGIEKENASEYVSIVAQNGTEFTIRISNHNANAKTFEENSEPENNISITIKSKNTKNSFYGSPNVNLIEFVYFKEDIQSSDANILQQITESLADMLTTATYVDKTGIAKINTSNKTPNSYSGNIVPQDNVIFVFGSNPEGRHGAGAAKTARIQFGAQYGVGEGLTGNAYALPTKDLRIKENRGFRSISPEQIIENIKKMYDVARQNPDKIFKVAYRNDILEKSLNGYTGGEMIAMFQKAGNIPENVQFSEEWVSNWDVVRQAIEQTNKCKGGK